MVDQTDRPGYPRPSDDEIAHQLDALVEDFGQRFGDRHDATTIRHVVEDTYRQLAEHATVQQHLVPLTANKARATLTE